MSDLEPLLRSLVRIESPTGHADGVRAVAARIADELERHRAAVRLLPGEHLLAELDGHGEPILVVGHTDTVWPLGTLGRMPYRLENGLAHGPGSYDMKGGLVVLVGALRETGSKRRALRIFLTADEEAGSLSAREPLAEAAAGVAAALVLEPPTAGGGLKTRRKGLRQFRLVVRGRAAHAGTGPEHGASAIEELAHQVLALKRLADRERGISVNVGVVRGGTRGNVVPDHAEAQVDIRIVRAEDEARIEAALHSLEPRVDGTSIEIGGGYDRPPLERSAGAGALFCKAREHGHALGLRLRETGSGGGSDANLLGALGVPVLDGLGAEGGGAHAPAEHVRVASLDPRARLLARLLEDPGI